MTGLSLRLAGLALALGLAAACAGGSDALAAAPKSKFEQAKIKAGLIYRKYYKAAFDSSLLGPEYKEVHEEAARLRGELDKALEEAADLDPHVRRAEAALERARDKPQDKQDASEIAARTEDLQIVRQRARADVELEANNHVYDTADDDDEAPKKAAVTCGAIDQNRAAELQKRIGIYEKRLADTQQEAKNINDALVNESKNLSELDKIELRRKLAVVERRIDRIKHDIEGFKKELEAALNPPPCSAPGKTEKKAEEKPEKKKAVPKTRRAAEKPSGQPAQSNSGGGTPGLSISIGIGGGGGGFGRGGGDRGGGDRGGGSSLESRGTERR
jgi:chromosome segregation ATPase